jgi:hypothetical protein
VTGFCTHGNETSRSAEAAEFDKLREYCFVKGHSAPRSSFDDTRSDKSHFKDEAYLFDIRTQRVPRCKHSPLRL